jgi:hypothetical protein
LEKGVIISSHTIGGVIQFEAALGLFISMKENVLHILTIGKIEKMKKIEEIEKLKNVKIE